MNHHTYWNTRFQNEGSIWTFRPCQSALFAREKFKTLDIHSILIPGAGYGRNAQCFVDSGYTVTGIEISERAIEIAKEHEIRMNYIHSSLLDTPSDGQLYDAIFCFNVLHLFLEAERKQVVAHFRQYLKENGYGFIVVLSDLEKGYGQGEELEPNTFESKKGKAVHYFTKSDLQAHFEQFHILETGTIDEPESRGGRQIHTCRYIFFQKHNSNNEENKVV